MVTTNGGRRGSAEIIDKETHMDEAHAKEWDDRGVEERDVETGPEFRHRLSEQYRLERERARVDLVPKKSSWWASFKAACLAVMGS